MKPGISPKLSFPTNKDEEILSKVVFVTPSERYIKYHSQIVNREMPRAKIHWTSAGSGDSSSGATSSGQSGYVTAVPSDWSKNGTFINKPPRGWLHPDTQISDGGICYGVRYVGCLEVNTSMKTLDFETRSVIAKECINRVCESAGLKTVDKKRKVEKRVTRMLADKPNMDYAGSNINLTITSSYLNLTVMESGEIIANHEMPNISFASGGDADTLDFIAYVAKDHHYGRACFVLECGGGLAQDVITTIGQAFELRFKEFLKRTPRAISVPDRLENPVFNGNDSAWGEDPEYYNDLPGKIPPEASPPVPPLPDYHNSVNGDEVRDVYTAIKEAGTSKSSSQPVPQARTAIRRDADNLIDLNTDIHNSGNQKKPEPEYVNTMPRIANQQDIKSDNSCEDSNIKQDPFDMQPFNNSLPSPQDVLPPPPPRHRTPTSTPSPPPHASGALSSSPSSSTNVIKSGPQVTSVSKGLNQKAALLQEEWFHGPISRKESETLVVRDGDFLVRESQGSPGQYVLTGMQSGIRKHLLLVDPEGVVRTKDRTFESVSHLINYHSENGLPIISAESALILRNPIHRIRPTR